MDFASIIGVIIGIGSLVLGYSIDGGSIRALWMLSAFIIVMGGSIGSVALSHGMNELKKMPLLYLKTFVKPKSNLANTLNFIVQLSETARKDGLLSIEKTLELEADKNKIDPLLKRGMLMVIDGADLEQIREHLEIDISLFEEKSKAESATFESLAGYAPAYGMIGTIMGLIQVLANMESPAQMAGAIGVAFITTLYGVIIANIFCLPASNKLNYRLKCQMLEKDMIVEGVCSIRNGQNPKILQEKLSAYLMMDPKAMKQASKAGKEVSSDKKKQRR